MEKILSFSIAAYNVEKTIEETLNSLVCDEVTMDCIEALIVDDGSTDNTYNKVRYYLEKYPDTFKYVKKENGGHGSTLTYSIQQARGKYLRMLDGDDLVYTEELSSYVSFLKETDADVIVSPFVEFYDSGEEKCVNRQRIPKGVRLAIEDSVELQSHEFAYRAELLRDKEIALEEHCYYTDTEYCFYVTLYATSIQKYGSPIYRYRKGVEGQTVSDEGRREHPDDPQRILFKILSEYNKRSGKESGIEKKDLVYNLCHQVMNLQVGNIFMVCDNSEKDKCYKYGLLHDKLLSLNRDYIKSYCERYYNSDCAIYYMVYRMPKRKQYVIWGCGKCGQIVLKLIKELCCTNIIVTDSNMTRWGESFCSEMIVSPTEAISSDNMDTIFIVAMKDGIEVKNQLIDWGVDEERIVSLT